MQLNNCRALLLNADFRPMFPLETVGWQDAVGYVVSDRVSVLAEHDTSVRSPSRSMRVPSILALREFRRQDRPMGQPTRRGIFVRDGGACCYCAVPLSLADLTFDHVLPRSRGGETSWENCAAACLKCNGRKRDRTPAEAGMQVPARLYAPTRYELMEALLDNFPLSAAALPAGWSDYLVRPSRSKVPSAPQQPGGGGAVFPQGMTSDQYFDVGLLR